MGGQLFRMAKMIFCMLAFVLLLLSCPEAIAQQKGDVVKSDDLIDYSIGWAKSIVGYEQGSHTIRIFRKGDATIVEFKPIIEFYMPSLIRGGEMTLRFKEVEGGYEFQGGVIGK